MSTKASTPKGFSEYLPADQAKFDWLKNKIAKSFTSYGFQHIATPAVEYLSTLSSQGDISKEVYSISRAKAEGESSESDRGLRFDLTKPLARYTAEHYNDLAFPFKRYQIQPVWRGERPQKGRMREFYQADVDIIGNGELPQNADFEVLSMIASTLDSLNIGKFVIRINNRKLLQGLLELEGIAADKLGDALRIIDKLEKIGVAEFENLLKSELNLTPESIERINIFLKQADKFPVDVNMIANPNIKAGTLELHAAYTKLPKYQNVEIKMDFKIARGLDYYTGLVFETNMLGYDEYGSLASGGRYENLASEFTNQKLPGVGGSIGLSRLFTLIQNEGIELPISNAKTSYLVTTLDQNNQSNPDHQAIIIRSQNLITESFGYTKKLDKALNYGIKKNYDYLVICEPDGQFTLKNLKTREQKTIKTLENL
jgi:histidyl-tRNA synthetase